MNEDEFNRLMRELCVGLPFTIVVGRLHLLVYYLVQQTDPEGPRHLREYCASQQHTNEYLEDEGPW